MSEGHEALTTAERRREILNILNNEGKVRVSNLAKRFSISEVTIRNDLTEMEKEGLLERVHGGAISTYKTYYRKSIVERMQTNLEEKLRIAAGVAELIDDGDTLLLNSGTTTMYVVRRLKSVKGLTILTNSIEIANEAAMNGNDMQVLLLGGNVNHQFRFTYGDDTIQQLKKYKADKLILSADGVSAAEGITTHYHLEAEVARVMIERVKRTIVVADYTKIGRADFTCIATADRIDFLVTNNNAPKDEISALAELGAEVKLV
jgi:DeoR/GlpR family transcriptional regulator of sugar metabolism